MDIDKRIQAARAELAKLEELRSLEFQIQELSRVGKAVLDGTGSTQDPKKLIGPPPKREDPNPANLSRGSSSPLPLVHSDLDEYGLDPYEFRIYAHIVRRTGGKLDGECFAKLEKMAETCRMSVRQAQYALATLCEAGLIIKLPRRGRTDIYKLTSKTNWIDDIHLGVIRERVKAKKNN